MTAMSPCANGAVSDHPSESSRSGSEACVKAAVGNDVMLVPVPRRPERSPSPALVTSVAESSSGGTSTPGGTCSYVPMLPPGSSTRRMGDRTPSPSTNKGGNGVFKPPRSSPQDHHGRGCSVADLRVTGGRCAASRGTNYAECCGTLKLERRVFMRDLRCWNFAQAVKIITYAREHPMVMKDCFAAV